MLCSLCIKPVLEPGICSCVSQVKYWRKHEDSEGGAQRVTVSGRDNHTKLEGLRADSNYRIEVRGYNSAGYGPGNEGLQIRTKKPRMLCFNFSTEEQRPAQKTISEPCVVAIHKIWVMSIIMLFIIVFVSFTSSK